MTVAERTQPDGVVLDHMLQGKSALDILPELRRLLPTAAIVLWSSAGGEKELALSLGANEVMDKSTSVYDLLDAIVRRQHVR